jgi:hypothetical protein
MIIKKMDSKQEEIAELTALLKGKLIPYRRSLIERELKAILITNEDQEIFLGS